MVKPYSKLVLTTISCIPTIQLQIHSSSACTDWGQIPSHETGRLYKPMCENAVQSQKPHPSRLLSHLQPLPRTLADLIGIFTITVNPNKADLKVLWLLVYL